MGKGLRKLARRGPRRGRGAASGAKGTALCAVPPSPSLPHEGGGGNSGPAGKSEPRCNKRQR